MNLFKFLTPSEKSTAVQEKKRSPIDQYIPEVSLAEINSAEDTEDPEGLTTLLLAYIEDFRKAVAYERREINSPLEIDRLATKIGHFYEKIRQLIDWKEDHIVRRSTIERILKRRLITKATGKGIVLNNAPIDDLAEPFVEELLRTGYFSNTPISKKQSTFQQKQ